MAQQRCCVPGFGTLTLVVEGQFVEPEPAGFFAHKLVRALGAEVVQGHGVRQRLHTRLQAEGNLGVACRVSAGKKEGKRSQDNRGIPDRRFRQRRSYLCPSTVHRETPHSSGLNFAS